MNSIWPNSRTSPGRTLAVLAGLFAFVAISFLTYNVIRQMESLNSASSDNAQWSLSQIEVEFLEFTGQLNSQPFETRTVRQRFDIFYSRISTVQNATVFRELRENSNFNEQLQLIQDFLDSSVTAIDSNDTVLMQSLPEMQEMAAEIRPKVRLLSNSGLELFAKTADTRRTAVAQTMTQLAVAVLGLISALAFVVVFLKKLNTRISNREREQFQTASRLNTIIKTSLDGVIVSDAHGKIIEFSPAAETMFGQSAAKVIGQDLGAVIVPDHLRDAHNAGMKRLRQNGTKKVVGKGRVKLEAKRANGEVFPVELAIQTASSGQQEIYIAFLRDISLRVAAEAELVSARDKALANEKIKTDFLATMSHEIRTPLNGLLGNMTLLRDTTLSPDQQKYIRNMETSGRLLMNHISDVLDITRYDAGKLTIAPQAMNVSKLLQDIIDNQSSTASANETTLDWGWVGPRMNWVTTDPDRLQHILVNLIGNAVKFTKRGKVSVNASTSSEENQLYLQIDVSDTGPGIKSTLEKSIFDDFVTGNTAYDRDVGGTGLGLSIAKRFTTALGGTIGVDSVYGEGSTFWVRIPITPAEPVVAQPASEPEVYKGKPLNVLLVEDNEINRVVAREMLEADGHHVQIAKDGLQGVTLAKEQTFDLILMDISMPVMDGRAATRKIRGSQNASTKTPIIALTANAIADEQEAFLSDGMNATLTKPLSRTALREIVRGIQDGPAPTGQAMIDTDHFSETRSTVGADAFNKLQMRFASEMDTLIDWLHSQDPLDRADISDRTHKVAGSASVFGANDLSDALKQISKAAKSGNEPEITALIDALPATWQETKTAFASI